MKAKHLALLAAPVLLAGLAAAYPKAWPAVLGLLLVAHTIAVFTHKPGAEAVIAELEADAEKVNVEQ